MSATSRLRVLTTILGTVYATQVVAEFKHETSNGGSALLYGQLDPSYLSFDDGASTTSEIADNNNSNSRIGFWYRKPTDFGKFSINLETSLGLGPSSSMSQNNTPDAIDWQRTDIRKVEAIWDTDRFGTIYLGQGSMSSDGASSQDLSGTTLVLYNSISDTAGAFLFRTKAGVLGTKTIGKAFGSYDGGRKARVRYDTPSYGGIRLSVSYGKEVLAEDADTEVADVGLLYSRQVGSVKMAGAVAYSQVKSGSEVTQHDTVGSFSLLHDTGVNVTVAAGNRKEAGNYVYGKLGYKADWLSVGSTALAIDYYSGQDTTSEGSESGSFGIGVVQSFDKAKVEAYLGYREYRLKEDAATYRDAASVLLGARWKF